MSTRWDCVSELRPPAGLPFIPQTLYKYGELLWNDSDMEKPRNFEKTCPSATSSTTNPTCNLCNLMNYRPGSQPGPPWWAAGDWPPGPWLGGVLLTSSNGLWSISDSYLTVVTLNFWWRRDWVIFLTAIVFIKISPSFEPDIFFLFIQFMLFSFKVYILCIAVHLTWNQPRQHAAIAAWNATATTRNNRLW
jgi:hypothetical protein